MPISTEAMPFQDNDGLILSDAKQVGRFYYKKW